MSSASFIFALCAKLQCRTSSGDYPTATNLANVPSGSNANSSGDNTATADKAHVSLGNAGASSAHAAQPGTDQMMGPMAHSSGNFRKPKSRESVRPSRDPKSADHIPTMAELAEEGRDLATHPAGQTVHVPPHPTSDPPNKLRNTVPSSTEGSLAHPQVIAHNVPGETALTSQAASRAPSVHPSVPQHDSSRASAHEPAVLEEVLLPDGRTAYIKSSTSTTADPNPDTLLFGHVAARRVVSPSDYVGSPSMPPPPPGARPPSTLKKPSSAISADETELASASVTPKSLNEGATNRAPAESELGKGHCSVCCPHGARLPTGVPIEACAHQNGALGEAVPGTSSKLATPSGQRSQRSIGRPGRPPSIHRITTPDGSATGEEEDIPFEQEGILADGSTSSDPTITPNKLATKRKTPNLTPEEEAMEDVRKLAGSSSFSARILPLTDSL